MSTQTQRRGIVVRKLADKSKAVERYNHATGETVLVNPDGGSLDKPSGNGWPLKGLRIEGDPPPHIRVPTSWVTRGVNEGWITLSGETVKRFPAGPPANPRAKQHTVFQADTITLHTLDGDVVYRVAHQPGKYVLDKPEAEGGEPVRECTVEDVEAKRPARMDWFFDADLA